MPRFARTLQSTGPQLRRKVGEEGVRMQQRLVAGSQGRLVSWTWVGFYRPRFAVPVLLLSALVVAAAGCSSANPLGRRPISGKVTLQGQPVDYGSIQFIPLDLQAANWISPIRNLTKNLTALGTDLSRERKPLLRKERATGLEPATSSLGILLWRRKSLGITKL